MLIVENYAHFWQVGEVYNFFSKNFDCEVIVNKKYKELIHINKPIRVFRYSRFTLLQIFFLVRKYDYIFINSSPEYPDYPKDFNSFINYFDQLISFFILNIFNRNKIILFVRGIYRVIPELTKEKKFYIYLRKFIFLFVKRIVCKNKNLENILKERFVKKKKILTSTLYTRLYYSKKKLNLNINKNKTIGVLGAIDPLRKDYSLLDDFLQDHGKDIHIIFLGREINDLSNQIIRKYEKYNITSFRNLSDELFIREGSKCDFLLSLNKEDKHYGTYKGTGSFGDALLLEKTLITPLFSDPIGEFKDFSYYYKDKKDLQKLLKDLINNKKQLKENFSNFFIDQVKKKFFKELKIFQ